MNLRATVTVKSGPNVKAPSVAGTFYPADAATLRAEIDAYLANADAEPALPAGHRIKAIIAPHAGYRFSGAVAASAYAPLSAQILDPDVRPIRRVVLYGPAHRSQFTGFAVHSTDRFKTPLGDVPIDKKGVEVALALPNVEIYDDAFHGEHSLEVQLPFLQAVLGEFAVIPLLVSRLDTKEAAEVINRLWGGPETLIVVSSDLSHYLSYDRRQETRPGDQQRHPGAAGGLDRVRRRLRPQRPARPPRGGAPAAHARNDGRSAQLRRHGRNEGPRRGVRRLSAE